VRRLAHGTAAWAVRLLGGGTIQTAYIERLNGTFRPQLAPLARRTRAGGRTVARLERGMWLVGTVDNCYTPHGSLADAQTPGRHPTGGVVSQTGTDLRGRAGVGATRALGAREFLHVG